MGVFGAALTTVALSYSHILGNPYRPTIGASGGVFAILIAFGMLFGDNEIMMIPFPFTIKAKYFVGHFDRGHAGICHGRRREMLRMWRTWVDCFLAICM